MTILFFLAFATTGALLMKKNGLSWVEGALWGGLLTFAGLIVVYFRIRSSKKNQSSFNKKDVPVVPDLDIGEKGQLGSMLRLQATRQILYGLAWWSGSAIAMYFALQSTGNTVYWFGGALGALFHWYRAYKIVEISRKSKLPLFVKNDYVLIVVTLLIAIGSFSKVVPEYFRIDAPTIGTCWAEAGDGLFAPVACWSAQAHFKAVSFANSAAACGTSSYVEP
jgi:4-hydroxybenzoate polyprenyltransferase